MWGGRPPPPPAPPPPAPPGGAGPRGGGGGRGPEPPPSPRPAPCRPASRRRALPGAGGAQSLKHPLKRGCLKKRNGYRILLAALRLNLGDPSMSATLDRKSTRLNSSHRCI